jgi:hypothetical protein
LNCDASNPQARNSIPYLLEEPDDFALSFFFNVYGPSNNLLDKRDHLEFLTPLYPSMRAGGILALSTMALASCLYIAWKSQRPDAPLSRGAYLRAIEGMRERICRDESSDEMLLSVLLLGQYEVGATFLFLLSDEVDGS